MVCTAIAVLLILWQYSKDDYITRRLGSYCSPKTSIVYILFVLDKVSDSEVDIHSVHITVCSSASVLMRFGAQKTGSSAYPRSIIGAAECKVR